MMRAEPIAPAAAERERHALEARFSCNASSVASPPPAHRLSPLSARRASVLPSASRDAAARRRYPALAGMPPSGILTSSTPHTARSSHAGRTSARSVATAAADLSDSDAGENPPGTPDASGCAPYDHSIARGPAFRATPPGRSPAASPYVGMRPSLHNGDLDRLDRLQMKDESRPQLEAATARFRARAPTAPRETARSVSEGSASTKVEGWDGGPTTPAQLKLPSGLNAGRGIPPIGLWPPDMTGMTDALATPAKDLHVQHAAICAPRSKPDAQRAEQIKQLQATIQELHQQLARLSAREADNDAQLADAAAQIEALQSELAGRPSNAPAQADAAIQVPRLALSPARSPLGLSRNMPASPSPPRATSVSIDARKTEVMAELDAANAMASRLLAEHLLSPAPPAPEERAPSKLPALRTPLKVLSPLGRAHARPSPAPSARTAPAAPQQQRHEPEELHQADLAAQVALLYQYVMTLRQQVGELMPDVAELKAQMASLQRTGPPQQQAMSQTPQLSEAPLAPATELARGHPASSPLRPSGAVLSSPEPGANRFRTANRSSAPSVPEAPPSSAPPSPPSGTRRGGEPVDDVSGTALSELELSRSIDASRVGPAPPSPAHDDHVVDHSHDPKKCRSCTITRRAERKRKALAKEAAAEAAAEAARIEADAAATEALCDRLDSLIATAEVGEVVSFVKSLGPEDQTRLANLSSQLLDEFFHQRQVYATLSDEVKQLNPHELKHTITAARAADALQALVEVAAKIDTLNQIMPHSAHI